MLQSKYTRVGRAGKWLFGAEPGVDLEGHTVLVKHAKGGQSLAEVGPLLPPEERSRVNGVPRHWDVYRRIDRSDISESRAESWLVEYPEGYCRTVGYVRPEPVPEPVPVPVPEPQVTPETPPAPSPAVSGDGLDQLRDLLINPDLLRTTVADLVQREVAKRPNVVVEVRKPDAPEVVLKGTHKIMPDLLHELNSGNYVYLYGEAGSGKTTMAIQAATALFGEDSVTVESSLLEKYEALGHMDASGNYHETPLYRAYKNGYAWVCDEIDNSLPPALSLIHI